MIQSLEGIPHEERGCTDKGSWEGEGLRMCILVATAVTEEEPK